ncbi:undecaprenyl-diphosphatase [Rhodoblastus acidophilus]|uniref:Undecaprenyl-diphosphatase n=1 Tax=Rhodoblastus acidophilus TaxID=1074 RepID=A0A212Q8Q4_RHOAC|nr:phosphatase PAP2 family protein [Rhodoblastus acidophilus]MCW2316481.1 undecaprenyl-diphosphatase [Rhodoblastus acidophilus]SNB55670.1 undecaprenyl-diphosphatase [Rhodoblastus acidophilus]
MEVLSGSRRWPLDGAQLAAPLDFPHALGSQALGAGTWARLAAVLQAADLRAVARVARTARPPLFKALAIGISWLGNGWFYPLLLAALVAAWGLSCLKIVVCAGLSAAALHLIYPVMKRAFRRRRPFQAAPELPSLLATLDPHSFPSGHTMTMVGVLTPVVMLWPAALASALVAAGGMAWSRVATAHHYPSDVLAGAALGAGVGYPITLAILRIWG